MYSTDAHQYAKKAPSPDFSCLMKSMLTSYVKQAVGEIKNRCQAVALQAVDDAQKPQNTSVPIEANQKLPQEEAKDEDLDDDKNDKDLASEIEDERAHSFKDERPQSLLFYGSGYASPRGRMLAAPTGHAAASSEKGELFECLDFLRPQAITMQKSNEIIQHEKVQILDIQSKAETPMPLSPIITSFQEFPILTPFDDIAPQFSLLQLPAPAVDESSLGCGPIGQSMAAEESRQGVESGEGSSDDVQNSKNEPAAKMKPSQKRQRITFEQQKVLQEEFAKNPVWKAPKMDVIAQRLGFTRAKVYKWHYDKVRTRQISENKTKK